MLTPEALAAFSEALKSNQSLKSFCVGHKDLGDAGLEPLQAGLVASKIAVLDLELKGLGLNGAHCLSRISHSHPHLKDLRLSRNKLCDESLRVLVGGLQHSLLEFLDLRENEFGELGVRALAEFVQSPTCSLQKLLLCGNALGARGAAAVAEAITPASTLEELLLEGTGCGDEGAVVLAAALGRSSRLRTLVLNECGITAAGALALAEGLSKTSSLTTLRLNNNPNVGDEGCRALVSLPGSTVRILDVGRCGLSSAVLSSCIGDTPVTHICLFGNRLAPGLEEALADPALRAAAERSRLVDLDVGGNALEQRYRIYIVRES